MKALGIILIIIGVICILPAPTAMYLYIFNVVLFTEKQGIMAFLLAIIGGFIMSAPIVYGWLKNDKH